jgi:citrate lyase alpha subunit
LDKGLIRINPKCKTLIKDLEQVEQNKLTFEKIKDKDNKLTHASDTLDYFIDYEYSLYNTRTSSTIQL